MRALLPTRVFYYGTDAALPERVPLRAGPLSLIYEAGDLRTVKWGEYEVLRRVYVAVRDRNWGTVAPVITNMAMDIDQDHFTITFDVANQEGPINFAWQGTITGSSDGVLTYTLDGIARSTFLRNRIGFCILHPAECAGAPCRIEHVVSEHMALAREEAALPVLIRPDQPLRPFEEMGALAHEVTPGVWANLRFAGDAGVSTNPYRRSDRRRLRGRPRSGAGGRMRGPPRQAGLTGRAAGNPGNVVAPGMAVRRSVLGGERLFSPASGSRAGRAGIPRPDSGGGRRTTKLLFPERPVAGTGLPGAYR